MEFKRDAETDRIRDAAVTKLLDIYQYLGVRFIANPHIVILYKMKNELVELDDDKLQTECSANLSGKKRWTWLKGRVFHIRLRDSKCERYCYGGCDAQAIACKKPPKLTYKRRKQMDKNMFDDLKGKVNRRKRRNGMPEVLFDGKSEAAALRKANLLSGTGNVSLNDFVSYQRRELQQIQEHRRSRTGARQRHRQECHDEFSRMRRGSESPPRSRSRSRSRSGNHRQSDSESEYGVSSVSEHL